MSDSTALNRSPGWFTMPDDSEFKRFIDTLKILGIEHKINWGPRKEEWQRAITKAGYNVTALACTVVRVGKTDFLFCNGQVHWIGDDGYGPPGLFMLSRDHGTGRVQNRVAYNYADNKLLPEIGLEAAKKTYPGDWGQDG